MSEMDKAIGLVNEGTDLYKEGKFADAVAAYSAAIRITPDDESTHFNLGLALARLGRVSEAKAAYQEALRLFPEYPEVHNNLGNLLASQGELAEATRLLAKAGERGLDVSDAMSDS